MDIPARCRDAGGYLIRQCLHGAAAAGDCLSDGIVIQFVFSPRIRFNGPTGDKNMRTIPQSTITEMKFGA